LLLEFIEPTTQFANYYETAGRLLAEMHAITAEHYGFGSDNFIGLTPQKNEQMSSWTDFYFCNRLEYQITLLEKKNALSYALQKLFFKLAAKIPDILPATEMNTSPSLLHGDLWKGNIMPSTNGIPAIFDPAVYYGHNEADLAIANLFGGFPKEFYSAYFSVIPKDDGFEYRQPIYKLYHILNHINLFGNSYETEAIKLMQFYL